MSMPGMRPFGTAAGRTALSCGWVTGSASCRVGAPGAAGEQAVRTPQVPATRVRRTPEGIRTGTLLGRDRGTTTPDLDSGEPSAAPFVLLRVPLERSDTPLSLS